MPFDPDGIHRALLNIVSATRWTRSKAKRGGSTSACRRWWKPDGEWVRIVVLDNGPGIPADAVNDIFRPFVSTKGSRGTGLGLPVSRKILREHGGDLTVQSQVGKGSKFVLRLPMKNTLAAEPLGTRKLRALSEPPPSED